MLTFEQIKIATTVFIDLWKKKPELLFIAVLMFFLSTVWQDNVSLRFESRTQGLEMLKLKDAMFEKYEKLLDKSSGQKDQIITLQEQCNQLLKKNAENEAEIRRLKSKRR